MKLKEETLKRLQEERKAPKVKIVIECDKYFTADTLRYIANVIENTEEEDDLPKELVGHCGRYFSAKFNWPKEAKE